MTLPATPVVVEVTDSSLRELQREWNDLAQRLPRTSYFTSGDWARAWWNARGSATGGQLAVWRSADSELAAVVALCDRSERLHPAFPMRAHYVSPIGCGIGGADHAGFLVDSSFDQPVRQWLDVALEERSFLGQSVAPERRTASLVPGSRVVGRVPCLVSPLPLPLSRSFGTKLRRYAQRLEREGVSVAIEAPGEVDVHHVEAFDRLQCRRRRAQGVDSAVTDFHLRILSELVRYGEPGWGLAAVVARRDDEVVGVLLGFQTAERFEFYQVGWEPALASLSVGSVMIDVGARWAQAQGLRKFDFLRGDEPYKRRFGAQPVFDQHVIRACGLNGGALLLRERRRRG